MTYADLVEAINFAMRKRWRTDKLTTVPQKEAFELAEKVIGNLANATQMEWGFMTRYSFDCDLQTSFILGAVTGISGAALGAFFVAKSLVKKMANTDHPTDEEES